ncbi:HalOD1 output domain-containing protein [Haloplanus halophilus]|uniref:HalOD1 output domain-containing protein n=1 Tax=Haloplanus halophilus TaxID=2949993 RepID=UPI0020411EB8|nr:HalOD1 output domain-containing protein [Haloplanus sp. GDY1]
MSDAGGEDHVAPIGSDEAVSEAIVRALAAVSNRPPAELSPLARVVDPDAVDRLFARSATVESLRFSYEGYEVTVEPNRVRVRDRR